MPLPPYHLMHPSARLTEKDKNLLYDWIDAEREKLLDGDGDEEN